MRASKRASPRRQHAELAALGIGQHLPRHVTLPDVGGYQASRHPSTYAARTAATAIRSRPVARCPRPLGPHPAPSGVTDAASEATRPAIAQVDHVAVNGMPAVADPGERPVQGRLEMQ